jgi:hypothetical protein
MFKILSKGKFFPKIKYINFRNNSKMFATQVEILPSQTLKKVQDFLSSKSHSGQEWSEIEGEILERLNFYSSDEYCDIVITLAEADRGTENLWDYLSRKIFDYELDIVQTEFLSKALTKSTRWEEYMAEPLLQNRYVNSRLHHDKVELFKKLTH